MTRRDPEPIGEVILRMAANFNEAFSAWQTEYSDRCGDEFVASVRRLGLIMVGEFCVIIYT